MDDDDDEDSRLFLSMLDAAAAKIFEACSEVMAAESSAIAVACNTETVERSTSNYLEQDNESCSSQLSPINTLPRASQASTYGSKSRKRRKRSWASDQHVLEDPSSARQITVSANEKTCAFEAGKPLEEFKAKDNFTFTKNFNQQERKGAFRSNVSSVGSSVKSLLRGDMLPSIPGNDGKCETPKLDDFSKDIHEAIHRIESLIPSLQKIVNGVQIPADRKNVGNLELRNNFSLNSDDGQVKDKRLRFQSPVPSVGSSSCFRRPKKDKSDRKAGKSHAREKRMMHFGDSIHKNNSRRKVMNGASRSKITLHNQNSEETSWSSPSSSSGTSVQQNGYPSSLTGSYLSTDLYSDESDETDGEYEKVRQSSRKWSGSSQTNTDYDTSSDYNSQDQYSDISPSSQGSSEWSHKWENHRVKKGKTVGRISKLCKKLGTIFHHHHHHYNDRDESDLGHFSLFKRLGKIFHRSGKNDHKRVKADKPRKPVNKSMVKKKQDVGHFRTLVDGLMRHMRHSKKPKKVGSGRHKSKRPKKKLHWWPKIGRGGVKVPNKGKVKLKRIGTKTAKMILT